MGCMQGHMDVAQAHHCSGMQVLLAPQLDLSDLPLKTFYRYALPTRTQEGATLT